MTTEYWVETRTITHANARGHQTVTQTFVVACYYLGARTHTVKEFGEDRKAAFAFKMSVQS